MIKLVPLLQPPDATGTYGVFTIPTISCAVIRCGTSRAVVVHGDELPGDESAERILYRLMTGNDPSDGLGGDHYQLNKVAVVYPTRDQHQFAFRFYQVDRAKGRLVSNMECANVAAGAGLFALISGIAVPDGLGMLHAINRGTGQRVGLNPVSTLSASAHDWRVCFHQDTSTAQAQPVSEPLVLAHADGRTVDYWVLERGNVFVLANAAPDAAEPELIEQLAASGTETAMALGSSWQRAAMPKVILYSVQAREMTQAVVHAACFFNGEMHNSLPGSGAMCLASFLAASHLLDVRMPAHSGTLTFHLMHPSGGLTVCVNWEASARGFHIVSTEFVTSVRLLMYGGAAAPPAEEGAP